MRRLLFAVVSLFLTLPHLAAAQEPRILAEMSEMNPALVNVALNTQFFLDLSSDLELSADQTSKLQGLLYQCELDQARLNGDIKIATAQIERLLAEPDVDVNALQQKLDERYRIAAQADFLHIKHALEAVKALSHEQHLKVFPAFRHLMEDRKQKESGNHETRKGLQEEGGEDVIA